MKYLLDSNAWIALLRQKSPSLLHQLLQHSESDVALCSVVLAELWFGAIRSGSANEPANRSLIEQLRSRYICLPFDEVAAEEYAQIRAYLTRVGQLIGPNDLMIAAIARAREVVVVTHNGAEFNRVPGLMVEDWQGP